MAYGWPDLTETEREEKEVMPMAYIHAWLMTITWELLCHPGQRDLSWIFR